jgi:hypothetical protein
MRSVGLTAFLLLLPAACGTPRERDCRVLLPRVEEAEAATSFVANARPDLTHLFFMQSTRSFAAARWLEGATLATDVKREVPPLVAALARHGEATKSMDGSLRALGFHAADGGPAPGPALSRALTLESRESSPFMDEVMTLNERCGIFLATPIAEHPECKQLAQVFARFLAPADEFIKSSAHVADCLADLAAVHSPAPNVERAIRALEALLRDAAAVAVAAIVDGPAVRLIAELRVLAHASGEQRAAQAEIAQHAAAIRATCTGSASAR